MSSRPQSRFGIVTLLLLVAGFVAAVMVTNVLFRGARLDLTENGLYTLADGTRNILSNIEEPINFYFFFSDEATADIPGLRTYAVRVRETLEEFAAASAGKLVLTEVDPLPFSEDEDRADQYGLQRISLGGLGDGIYLGLAATNSIGDQEIVPFFQPSRESFLEYDLAKLISNLADPDRTVVGLLTALPMTVGFDPQTQSMREPWVVTSQAQQLFELRTLQPDLSKVDDDVDILWIVHPKDLDESTLYAIDQFILGGGKALIFVDPLAEIEAAQMPPGNPAAMLAAQGSNLERLFAAWGLRFAVDQVVADNRYALTISGPDQRPVRHLGLLGVDAAGMSEADVTTADLSNVNFGTSGFFSLDNDADATMEVLVASSTEAGPMGVDNFRLLQNPDSLREGFSPTGETYPLVARVGGRLPTAFPDGAPAAGKDENSALPNDHRTQSGSDASVIVVGDVDVLSDRLWVQTQNFFGRRISTPFANNGDLVTNLLDNLSGSVDLIGIRSRTTSSRPFTVVDDLRRQADAEFRATEQRLQAELQETEARLTELQSARQEDTDGLLLSSQQQSEIDRFIDQRNRIRKDLRSVQRNLDQDIEDLGTRLKLINIWVVPLIILGLGLAVARRK